MPEIAVNIEVYCAKCGAGLCNQTEATKTRYRGEPSFRVAPCSQCLKLARNEGYDEGYADGEREAVKDTEN